MKNVWIGIVEVIAAPTGSSVLQPGKAAFVKSLAYVETGADFTTQVTELLRKLGLVPVDFIEIEEWDSYITHFDAGESLCTCASDVRLTQEPRLLDLCMFDVEN